MSTPRQVEKLQELFGQLLTEHRASSSAVDLTRYADDPVGFMRDVLQFEPWSAQVEVAEEVRENRLVAVAGCNAAGKDAVAAQLALWWVYARKGLVLISSATAKQLQDANMVEVKRAFDRAGGKLPGQLFQMALKVGGEPRILAFTSNEASRMTGFHHARILAILSEAQGIDDFAWEGLMACATGPDDRMLAVGNPTQPSGRFYVASKARGSSWSFIKISAERHPNIVAGRTVIPGGPSPEWVRQMAQEWGRDSSQYRSRVLAEFPDQGQEALIARSWVDAAVERHGETLANELWATAQGRGQEPVVAVDVAQYGPDQTVLGVRRGDVLERFVAWSNTPLDKTAERIAQEARDAGMRPGEEQWGRIVVDSLGVGAGVADLLKRWHWKVVYFNASRRDVDRSDRFLNWRAEALWKLRERFEQGRIAVPKDELLIDELIAVKWGPSPSGQVQIEPKDDLKGRIGRSPDRADCLMMAFYPGAVREMKLFPFAL